MRRGRDEKRERREEGEMRRGKDEKREDYLECRSV